MKNNLPTLLQARYISIKMLEMAESKTFDSQELFGLAVLLGELIDELEVRQEKASN